MPLPEQTDDEWFISAVLPHKPALIRYIHRHWPDNPSDVLDICQEVLTRVYTAAAKERPEHIKAFMFSVAQHLLCDLVRRAQVVRIDMAVDMEALPVAADEVSVEERLSSRQELRQLQEAMQSMPKKRRAVIEMRRIHGLSQKETAKKLGMTEAAVQVHVHRGVCHLADAMRHVSDIAAARLKRMKQRGGKGKP